MESSFYQAFRNVVLGSFHFRLNKLAACELPLSEAVKKLKESVGAEILLCGGLYHNFGVAVFNAMKRNNITVLAAEHGITAGLSRWRQDTVNYYEPRTADYMLSYNKSASRAFLSSANKNIRCVECGAPNETKTVRYYSVQRWISRMRLNVKGSVVYYVSSNLLTNNQGYFSNYMPDHMRFKTEKELLTNVFPKVNKQIVYKTYPSQNYLYQENPYLRLAKSTSNIVVAPDEDFRYGRAAADILITSKAFSTLGWCIGTNVPIVFLDSSIYHSLANEQVKDVFCRSFFYFDTDIVGWQQDLMNLLNKPMVEIRASWEGMKQYREMYDEEYFLNKRKDAGSIGASFIKEIL
jgi:hypothetical protein